MAARALKKQPDTPPPILTLVPPLETAVTVDADQEAPGPVAEPPAGEPNGFAVEEVEMEIRYLMFTDKEGVAAARYADAVERTGAERPSPKQAMDACDEIAKKGAPPEGYVPPADDVPKTPEEQVVHPPDPAFAPTSHAKEEPEPTVYTGPRFAILGTKEQEHQFVLTDEEKDQHLIRIGRHVAEGARLKASHAAMRKQLKKEMDKWEDDHAVFGEIAETGIEVRTITVEREADYRDGVVRLRIQGTAEYLPDTEPVSDEDRQLALFKRSEAAGSAAEQLLDKPADDIPPLFQEGDKEPQGDGDPSGEDEEDDDEDSEG